MSKWLLEENEIEKWDNMEIDGERRGRVFGADITNKGDHGDGVGSMGQIIRQPWLVEEKSTVDNLKQDMARGEGVEIKDLPVVFIDGKKRQRFQSEVSNGLMKMGSKNTISAANKKLADRTQ